MNIIVTGGASGLGLEITKKLLSTGHKVFFTYNRSAETARSIEKEYTNAKGFFCDYSDKTSVDNFVNEIASIDPDILINNAITKVETKHFHKMNAQQFMDGFANNLIPAIQITQNAIMCFRKKKFGKIINILSSYIINRPPVGLSEYNASKSYLYALHRSWVAENSNFNITSNCISPSFMQTPMNNDVDSRIIENMVENTPLKKILTTTEVAETVQFFVDCSQQINGQNLYINQGADI
jgi:3-oxoacyl-[acyl-carrier protein] reductase